MVLLFTAIFDLIAIIIMYICYIMKEIKIINKKKELLQEINKRTDITNRYKKGFEEGLFWGGSKI